MSVGWAGLETRERSSSRFPSWRPFPWLGSAVRARSGRGRSGQSGSPGSAWLSGCGQSGRLCGSFVSTPMDGSHIDGSAPAHAGADRGLLVDAQDVGEVTAQVPYELTGVGVENFVLPKDS